MSCTISVAPTTSARCSAMTNTPRGRSPSPLTQTAPFSATANAPGRTASPIPASACGSCTCESSTFPATPSTAEATRAAPSSAASAATAARSAAASATRTSFPATAATASASFATGSSKRTPTPERSGACGAGGAAARSASRIRRRLSIAMSGSPHPRPPPGVAEALPGGRRQLAAPAPHVPPPLEERPRQDPQGEAEQPPRRLIERAVREDEAQQLHSEPLRGRDEPARREIAPLAEQLPVQVDLHGADRVARAAQRGGERQRAMGGGIAGGREDAADRPGHHPAVAVPSAAPEHRAGVHAGAAADAGERAAHGGIGEEARAAVVDDDDV